MADEHTTAPGVDRRQQPRGSATAWKTAITHIERNRILIRGYHVDEMMARVSFSEAIYLLLMGELPHAGHRQDDLGHPRLVRGSRRDAAVHHRRAQRRHDGRAAAGRRRRGRARVRRLPRRRRGSVHAHARRRPRRHQRAAARCRTPRSASSTAASIRDSVRQASATGCTRATRAPCASCSSRWSSSSTPSTSA